MKMTTSNLVLNCIRISFVVTVTYVVLNTTDHELLRLQSFGIWNGDGLLNPFWDLDHELDTKMSSPMIDLCFLANNNINEEF